MTDDERPAGETRRPSDSTDASGGSDPGRMRARAWTVAAVFNDPADYGIPSLPEWTVYKGAGGGMALGAEATDGVFITAAEPMDVRR